MIGNSSGIIIEQKQTVKLTPMQLRTIEILQMSTAELQEKIAAELLENPVLETASPEPSDRETDPREFDREDPDVQDDYDRYDMYDRCEAPIETAGTWSGSQFISRGASRAAEFEKFYKSTETLRDHLFTQLMSSKCGDSVRAAAEYIIYSLNSDGYLDMDLDELTDDSGYSREEVRTALEIVRSMDPAGIGAWTLADCLVMQLDETDRLYPFACKVAESMLHEVATGDVRKIAKTLGISQDDASGIIAMVKGLDPKPGTRYSDGDAVQYIIPDAEIEIIRDKAVVHMTDVQPPLALNKYYCELAAATTDKEVLQYLKDRIDSANQLIDNIEQRKRTVENVTLAILARQRTFLEPGNKILEPLTMQQIADDLGIHVSTVSRAVREKYIRFPTSTYPLKHFFTSEIGGVSRDNIYSEIRTIIENEDKAHPLSDQKIADILMAKGIETSRRTVAKYRDSMGILPKSLRKNI